MRRVGRDAAVAAQLERGHENAHGVLLVSGEAVDVVVQHLVEVQRQLWPVLSDKTEVVVGAGVATAFFVKASAAAETV